MHKSDKRDAAGNMIFATLSEAEKADIRLHDLAVIRDPYVVIGLIVLVMLVVIGLTKMPSTESHDSQAYSKRKSCCFSRVLWVNLQNRNKKIPNYEVLYRS